MAERLPEMTMMYRQLAAAFSFAAFVPGIATALTDTAELAQ